MNEPEELSDIAMSDQNTRTEAPEEESSGGFSLEAKAGLTLICLLAVAFSYMVWQKWKELEHSQVVQDQKPSEAREQESSESSPQDVTNKPETGEGDEPPGQSPEPPTTAMNPGGTGNAAPPPTLNLEIPQKPPAEEVNPFAAAEQEPVRRPANIPTLEVPRETGSNSVTETRKDLDPFDDKNKSAAEEMTENVKSASAAETKPADDFDPFGPESGSNAATTGESAASAPDETPIVTDTDPFASDPDPKTTEEDSAPFATAPDPFADPRSEPRTAEAETDAPALDFADSQPLPEETSESDKNAEADPFGDVDSQPDPVSEKPQKKPPREAENETPVKVTPGDSFQEPLPLLEPVPEQNSKPPQGDPFGEFEGVPAGAAQASSVTQVSPGTADSERSGTLADLDTTAADYIPANSDPSPFGENPFAKPQPKPAANGFKRNPDGTYEIRQGDNYWMISRRAYGSSRYYRALAEYNRNVIADPQQMNAGKSIMIPPVQELERKLSQLIPETPSISEPEIVRTSAEQDAGFFTDEAGRPMYRVQENDTLTGISQRHLGRSSRWIQIYELNRDKLSNPNELKIGTTLKLPGDASRVRVVKGQ